MHEACCYNPHDGKVKCNLCLLKCIISEGKRGFCKVRENRGGKLYNTIYGRLSSFSVDYVEKIPLYHFYPNHRFLTVGSLGCNLRCRFCLTWNLTQVEPREVAADVMDAERIVKSARELNCRGIVYTHSEPTLNLEYYLEIMKLARKEGIVNAFATNGLISSEGLDIISDYLDAIALTVKGTEDFYGKICGFRVRKSDLMRAVEDIREREIHLELVYVLIPGFNDDEASLKETVEFAKAGRSPLIFLRFFPSYKMDNLNSTPEKVLEKAVNFAYSQGVKYAYLENIYAHPAKNTYCEECRRLLIRREGYGIVEWNLNEKRCPACGAQAPIVGEPFL